MFKVVLSTSKKNKLEAGWTQFFFTGFDLTGESVLGETLPNNIFGYGEAHMLHVIATQSIPPMVF